MPLDVPNIVPPNNLRLPDALTIKYGPAPLLARFLLAADKAARRKGVTLRVRYDFDELLHINRRYVKADLWYPLLGEFNQPEGSDLSAANAVWVSGEDESGEIVATAATRIFDWTATNLAEQARFVMYGRDEQQPCIITAEAASEVTGIVAWGYGAWVRPDNRGKHLSFLIPKVIKAYVASRWPVDIIGCYMGVENFKRGLASSYGYRHVSQGILYPGHFLGEQVIAYSTAAEYYEALTELMAGYGAVMQDGDFQESAAVSTGAEHIVTSTSWEGVFQGSMSRR
jgi:hypothetical protein